MKNPRFVANLLEDQEKKYLMVVFFSGIALSIMGFFLSSIFGKSSLPSSPAVVDQLSSDKGCEVQSGYVWCEPLQKCLRLYEEKCEGVISASPTTLPE